MTDQKLPGAGNNAAKPGGDVPRLSATVLLVRDGPTGLELFMVVRHHQIDFASGALVFPGGSTDDADRDARLMALCDGLDGLSEQERAVRVSAAREAFEECGVLLARTGKPGGMVDGARAASLGEAYRARLEAGGIGMADIMEQEGLRLALDQLHHYAHWVTPTHMPKRFDTHFFLAEAPFDHSLLHDGREAVDSVWISPAQALSEAEQGSRTVIFPTRLNLEKLSHCGSVAEAIAFTMAHPVVKVMPVMERREGKKVMRIPAEAGYSQSEYTIEEVSGGMVTKVGR
ncbi:MAG TPA: NUDIX hydrolase [Hyphomicrobiaceae bacterium]|nr:NUDIX hydrolase [Hyphomicrobiaceae bacterium]